MKRTAAVILVLMIILSGCVSNENNTVSNPVNEEKDMGETNMEETHLIMKINNIEVTVTWQDNDSVRSLMELVEDETLIIEMSMYGGFEQLGSIGKTLPRNDVQTVTSPGDIVLYSGNQIVVFYGSNSWSYTGLGK